jgi:tRNA threonylcarbamoyladenosine biosynthesis protein TsaB
LPLLCLKTVLFFENILFLTLNKILLIPYLIHIETSTDICSVALSRGNETIGIAEEQNSKHIHSITLLIDKLMQENGLTYQQLSGVSISEGPGSYTSLRIGVSVAKGLCFTLDIPMIAIPSLESLAYAQKKNALDADFIMPMIDARRMEVYTAIYNPSMQIQVELQAFLIDDFTLEMITQGKKTIICGNGAFKTSEFVTSYLTVIESVASASNQIEIAYQRFLAKTFTPITNFEPNYLKSPNITIPKNRTLNL